MRSNFTQEHLAMVTRRRFTGLAAASLLAPLIAARGARAQAWPTRPVRIVIGFGGGMEAAARILGQQLTAQWGQPVIVEPKFGASGNLAAEAVARAAPDGYTLLLAGTPLAVNRYLYASLPYDSLADFTPVCLVCTQPNVMVVPDSSPVRSVAEFVALAKASPGKLTYGSAGHGTALHLCGELFKRQAGVDVVHVPYRGAIAMADLIGGRVDTAFPTLQLVLPALRAGQVRGLAVAWPKRIASVPELPTFTEAGLPGLDDVALWHGLFAPAKTPPEIVQRLHADAVTALAAPELRARLANIAATPVGSTPAQLAGHVRFEMDRWAPLIKEARITITD
jgi:tripartite-type tricarboxylate transporter receptor subunit TctC